MVHSVPGPTDVVGGTSWRMSLETRIEHSGFTASCGWVLDALKQEQEDIITRQLERWGGEVARIVGESPGTLT